MTKVLEKKSKIINLLKESAKHHSSLKYYTSRDHAEDMVRDEVIYLSDGTSWNDIQDRECFNKDECFKRFGLCFSWGAYENIAMWMLYANNDGCMVNFGKSNGKLVSKILDIENIEVGYFNEKEFKKERSFRKGAFTIELIDVPYLNNVGEKIKLLGMKNIFLGEEEKNMLFCRKEAPWKYEQECRLVVTIKKDDLDRHFKANIVKISLACEKKGNKSIFTNRVYVNPNSNVDCGPYKFLKSKLQGRINWNIRICDKDCGNYCMCKK